ncbi:RluA family pseudouridine synthase [Halovulum sp. GXIMD14793]
MSDPSVHIVDLPEGTAERLDKALARIVPEGAGLSRSRLQALIAEGAVTGPDGPMTNPKATARPGTYHITLPPPKPLDLVPEAIPLDILYEDEHLIVVNKAPGMVVHPAPGSETGTLVHALLAHCGDQLSGIGGVERPGIVHRIDKDTSGCLVVAKTAAAHTRLSEMFKAGEMEKAYTALCWGHPDPAAPHLRGIPHVRADADANLGTGLLVEAPIGRHRTDRKRMAVQAAGGRVARTKFFVREVFGPQTRPVASLVHCQLFTGRTHQIRVHLAHIHCAIIGDPVYARPRALAKDALPAEVSNALRNFPRQALHAATLGFDHPVTGEKLLLSAPLPADFNDLLDLLRQSKS